MTIKNCDLIYRLIVAISLEYLLFFGLEAVLPGVITNILNINILLVLIIILLGILFGAKNCQEVFTKKGQNKFLSLITVLSVIFLMLVVVIIWHHLSILLIIVYITIGLLGGGFLWKNI